MKHAVIILAGGTLGLALTLAVFLSGLVSPPSPAVREPARIAGVPEDIPAALPDHSKEFEALRDDLRKLGSRLAAGETEFAKLSEQLDALKSASSTHSRPPQPEPPAYRSASPEAEAAWLRLMLREVRPKAYREAIDIVEKRFVPALKKYYLDRKTCVGADMETLMPSHLGKTLWRWNDFSFTVKNVNEAEIQLDADPELPKLRAKIRFGEEVRTLDDRMEMVGWNKLPHLEEAAPLPRGEARVSTARASLGALKDRVRVFYMRKNVLPKSVADLDVSDAELQSEDFNASDYSFSGTEEAFVITCRAVFKDDPYDLTITVNLKTGEASFNR